MLLCIACEWHFKTDANSSREEQTVIKRYDQLESLYLTTGDFSALQHMNTDYPVESRTLIENVLKLGEANDPNINTKLLNYFQDSTLQQLVVETEKQYSNIDDIGKQLGHGLARLKKKIPGITIPQVYAQIGALDQSIIVGDGRLGIMLDKYLGADYPLYKNYYSQSQRKLMTRSYIVSDCIFFYLLSVYPEPADRELSDLHKEKIKWVVNKILKKNIFDDTKVMKSVDAYMHCHPAVTYDQLLRNNDRSVILSQSSQAIMF